MNGKIFAVLILCLFHLSPSESFAQKKMISKKEPRNVWGIGLVYSENGFGISSTLYAPISKKTDLCFNLQATGVTDSREFEQYDIYGNTVVPGKINRIFAIPLSVGIRNELFKNELEGEFSPSINLGLSSAIVFTSPYERSFFNALGYMNYKFAGGGYAGIGVSYKQDENIALAVNLNYYYLQVFGGGVQSLESKTINNVGGLQLTFGVNFLD